VGPINITSLENPITYPEQPQADVLIVVQPALVNVNLNDTFSVIIQVQSGSQLLDGAEANLDFDPSKLQVIGLTGNTTAFPLIIQSQFNNTNGTIDYAAGTFSNFPSGNVNLVVIQFKAISEAQTTDLVFHYGGGRNTDATYGGYSVLTGSHNGQMQIGLFNKTSPGNGDDDISVAPTLTWTSSLGATRYEYCYDTSNDNACSPWTTNGTDTSIGLSQLYPDTTYYWHVRAVNGLGNIYSNGSSTAFWSFRTENPTPVRLVDFSATSLPEGIQLDWQTGQEVDLLGFNLYRAEALDGPREMLNPELIPAINPGDLRGNAYQYLDATAVAGKTYYYWVEWVGNNGSEFYGPETARLVSYRVWLPVLLK
jgi:hypothetical protein